MSRSYNKTIVKYKPDTRAYHRTIRREWNQSLMDIPRNMNTDWKLSDGDFSYDPYPVLRNSKEIINDYDYCDWKFGYGNWWSWFIDRGIYEKEYVKQLTRK